MTREKAKEWIVKLISAMKEETNGMWADPQYKDEVYEALDEAIKALSAETVSKEVYDSEYYRRKDAEFKLHELTHKEPCEDVISRQSVLEWIQQSLSEYGYTYTTDMLDMWELFEDWIKNAPPVEAVPLLVIERITTEIEERATYEGIYLDRADVLEIIDKAVKECTHEQTCICGNG